MDPLSPECLGVGPPWIRPAPVRLTHAPSDWDLGNLEAQSTPWALYCVPQAVPEQCLQGVRGHCPAGGPLPSGSVVVMRGCTWSTTVFGWVVRVKWCSHECQQPRFPHRTLYCDEMINVIHCQWF